MTRSILCKPLGNGEHDKANRDDDDDRDENCYQAVHYLALVSSTQISVFRPSWCVWRQSRPKLSA
jgi:hypothetical protein